jgi:Fe-S cluster assembly ATP-binding protein
MSELIISDLHAEVADRQILNGVNLTVRSGEVHALMGPNGSGKSTLSAVLMGRSGYRVTSGSVTLDGADLLEMSTFARSGAGLFLGMQYPVEVPGVTLRQTLHAAALGVGRSTEALDLAMEAEADRVGLGCEFLDRALNVDCSGGEKKRIETVQLGVLRPKFAILDEIDSGLDVDGLDAVSRRVEAATGEWNLGVLVVTHYQRLLEQLRADVVHVFSEGRIVETGGPELAEQLEITGYGDRPEVSA